ncbi:MULTISPECIES: tRNA pseudouridine(38-40) synthase TruA [unclassified Granulicatella]|uniref:tRNA pseudouridine(38-40) synthase TruA n=1 Tax=unclassified Granulicatella TaxID=2630493 RepID=UPI00107318F0|nr:MULTISPECIES: tRNA pseudouridine(38-40) synthase TruA [unclassified Granulicatella]MBF0779488.1 tRNA pseudouridine(38-40) synthase TruA [Granulicatella sp. 19428wC4_WM01]TFU96454.1 tRNA pseudouridine(38-40) synthase TruA [Granulicatella sp. WM01]
MKQRYKVTLAYDGTNYVGFQRQINGNSIQAEIEKALKKMTKGLSIAIVASGRTDSGVHAKGQVIHFDYPCQLEEHSLKQALNSLLPSDIRICLVEKVSQLFHARYHTCQKMYHYRVSLGDVQSPFLSRYALHHRYSVDISKMNEALGDIIGEHDFTSFCSTKSDKDNKVRCIKHASVEYDEEHNELVFVFIGDGFLYNMVRILVGTTLQIGDGLKPVHELRRLLEAKDRRQAGPTALAHGLYLMRVDYKAPEYWFQTYEENKRIGYND